VIKTLCPIFSGWRVAWIKGMSSWIFSLSLCLSEKKTQLFRVEKCCEERGGGGKKKLFMKIGRMAIYYCSGTLYIVQCTCIRTLYAQKVFAVDNTVSVHIYFYMI
jgi:hypothetical protein